MQVNSFRRNEWCKNDAINGEDGSSSKKWFLCFWKILLWLLFECVSWLSLVALQWMKTKQNADTFIFIYFVLISMHFYFLMTFSSYKYSYWKRFHSFEYIFRTIDLHKFFSHSLSLFLFEKEKKRVFDMPNLFAWMLTIPFFFAFHKIGISFALEWNLGEMILFIGRLLHVFDWIGTGHDAFDAVFLQQKMSVIFTIDFQLEHVNIVHSIPFIRLVSTSSFNWKVNSCNFTFDLVQTKNDHWIDVKHSTTVFNKQNTTLSVWSAI